MSRPILAQLDLQALKDNLQIVRRAAPGSRVWSVVKANAYGHGIDRIWSALGATDGFALLNLEEAILLRERGWKDRSCCWKDSSMRRICLCWISTA